MHDYRYILFMAGFLRATVVSAFLIEGTSHSGMKFAGELLTVHDNRLLLRDQASTHTHHLALSLQDIKELWLPAGTTPEQLASVIEQWLPLLPLWDPPTFARLVDAVRQATREKDWATVHALSSRLVEVFPDRESAFGLKQLRVWALFEMGLLQSARVEVQELAKAIDPLEAPARLCWLMAHLEVDPIKALAWARLPALQIPSLKGPVARELEALAIEMQSITSSSPHANNPF
jgi:hypothetical protein